MTDGSWIGLAVAPAHLVGAGGAIGALLRYGVYLRVDGDAFPYPTLVVNVLGSFVLGVVVFGGGGETTLQLVGVGVCGSFTTFSTFSVETVEFWDDGRRRVALANAAANLVVSLAAIGVAWLTSSLIQ